MASGPSFSVVLPVYRSDPALLREQIDALLDQRYDDVEIIVVDDGCPFGTGELVRSWVGDLGSVRVHVRAHNGGIAAATNDGLDAAAGDFVVFVDHDDLIERGALTAIAEYIRAHPATDIVYTDERLIDEHGALIAEYGKPDWSPQRFLGHNYINHLTAIRRELLGAQRLRREYEPAQDYDLLLRLTPRARHIGHVRQRLYSWRAVTGSLAYDVDEKRGVGSAVLGGVRDALAARGVAATVTARNATCLRVDYPASSATVHVIDARGRPRDLDAVIRATDAEIVVLAGGVADASSGWADALGALAAREAVGAVGPKLISRDAHLVSGGRSHRPHVRDTQTGIDVDNPGPWGAFLVTREVSSVAPIGLAVRRDRYLAVGGLPHIDDLDAAVAVLCFRLRIAGYPSLWTPNAVVTVTDAAAAELVDVEAWERRDAALATLVEHDPSLTNLFEEPYPLSAMPLDATLADAVAFGANVYGQIRAAVDSGDVQLLTSDVFDTLVWRDVDEPHHLWLRWAAEWIADGRLPAGSVPHHFALARAHAEFAARGRTLRELDTRECTLEEIWDEMPDRWVVGSRAEMIDAELDVEAAALRLIPGAVTEVRHAARRGIPVVLISDMYLSAEQLGRVLTRVGLPIGEFADIVTSSSRRRSKIDGVIADVITEHGVDPSAVLHIGDNYVADIVAARRVGANAVHTAVGNDCTIPLRDPVTHYSSERGTDAGVGAAIRATLLEAGVAGTRPGYQFGVGVAGPVVAGFAAWAADTAASLGGSTLHCLLREGAMIAEVVERVRPGAPTRLVHASRWVMLRAAVTEGTVDQLDQAIARRARFRAEHIADAFDLDLASVQRVVGAGVYPHGERLEAFAAIAEHDELRGRIVEASTRVRARVMRYLERTLQGLDTGRLVVCDVGWGGTIQTGLERILAVEGIDVTVTGLYLALSPSGDRRQAEGLDLRSYLPSHGMDDRIERSAKAIIRSPEIVERVLTPRQGTLIDIDDDGQPITRPADHDARPESLEDAQAGMLAMATTLAATSRTRSGVAQLAADPWVNDPAWRAVLGDVLAQSIAQPPQELARVLGEWPHDDVAGTGTSTLAHHNLDTVVDYLDIATLHELPMDEVFWVPGLVAGLDTAIAAQWSAVASGVDAEALAPPGPLGAALVAVFGEGLEASLQLRRPPRTNPHGWHVCQVEGDVEGVRVVRIDPGERAGLIRLARLRVELEAANAVHGEPVRWVVDTSDAADGRLLWQGARALGGPFVALGTDATLLVTPPAEWLHRACRASVTFIFAAWDSDAATALATTSGWGQARDRVTRRLRGARQANRRRRSAM